MVVDVKYIDASRLRITVFDILHATSSLDLISINELRRNCEKRLKLEANSLDGPEVKSLLTSILAEFQAVFLGRTDALDNNGCKSNKFSALEKEFVMKIVHEYYSNDAVGLGNICSSTRLPDDKTKLHTDMWQELCVLVPHRKKHALQQLVQRELMKGRFQLFLQTSVSPFMNVMLLNDALIDA